MAAVSAHPSAGRGVSVEKKLLTPGAFFDIRLRKSVSFASTVVAMAPSLGDGETKRSKLVLVFPT